MEKIGAQTPNSDLLIQESAAEQIRLAAAGCFRHLMVMKIGTISLIERLGFRSSFA